MDPVRRALFLLLFASVLAAEPREGRAWAGTDRAALPGATAGAAATGRWMRRLAVTLRRAVEAVVEPVKATFARSLARRPTSAARRPTGLHATFAAHAFRLPPPMPVQ